MKNGPSGHSHSRPGERPCDGAALTTAEGLGARACQKASRPRRWCLQVHRSGEEKKDARATPRARKQRQHSTAKRLRHQQHRTARIRASSPPARQGARARQRAASNQSATPLSVGPCLERAAHGSRARVGGVSVERESRAYRAASSRQTARSCVARPQPRRNPLIPLRTSRVALAAASASQSERGRRKRCDP